MLENPDLLKSFYLVVGLLFLQNAGGIFVWVRSFLKRLDKIDRDLKAAHDGLRAQAKVADEILSSLKRVQSELDEQKQSQSWGKK